MIDRATVQLIITKLDTNAVTLKEVKAFAARFGAGDVPGRTKEQFIRNLCRMLPKA